MSELDDKLKAVIVGIDSDGEEINLDSNSIAAIKQAFTDAGWERKGIVGTVIEMPVDRHEYVGANGNPNIPLMTGQEWYDRFINELGIDYALSEISYEIYEKAKAAAKRAAGVE